MRKTLILAAAVLTAGALAACKPFWEKEQPPATAATATDSYAATYTTTTPEPASDPAATALPAGDKAPSPPAN